MPSGQLFTAAGLMTVPLAPLTAAFFAGRLVSYSIYVSIATIAERNLGAVALDSLTGRAHARPAGDRPLSRRSTSRVQLA